MLRICSEKLMGRLGDIRNVVTGHNAAGKSGFKDDQSFSTQEIPSGYAEFTVISTAPLMIVTLD
jgi:hypothetical protein